MLVYKGKYNVAKVYIDVIDPETVSQIYSFLNHPAFANTSIRIMPDTHAGKGSVIGFTMTLNNYVIPNIVGVDIGCGMLMYPIPETNLEKFDEFIKNNIPAGFATHANEKELKEYLKNSGYEYGIGKVIQVANRVEQTPGLAERSLGTLGGGNHFIEIDHHEGQNWLVIHTGSRNFGLKVCDYYQKKAKALMNEMFIGDAYKNLEFLPLNNGGTEYLNSMRVAQWYAERNRDMILRTILTKFFNIKSIAPAIECVHNYIGKDNIIRKGAISAQEGERVIIPLNMRDGVIIGTGKGNKDWNYSAPHGAGRILSRKKAKEVIVLEDFQKSMDGIYTSCVNQDTLDESPMVYKDKELIISAIQDTVDIEFVMKPIYNFKAGGD
jgi:RNA-splicing ligase RtcB